MINRLILQNFRNYSFHEVTLTKNVNFIVGKNGKGKTNLLEAISLLSTPSGFRGAEINALNKNFSFPFSLGFETDIGEIGIANTKTGKKITYNGDSIGFTALASNFKIFFLLPENELIFRSAPSEKRDFFDKLCSKIYPAHEISLKNLKSLSLARMKILEGEQNIKWLETIEKQIAELFIILATNRVLFCEEISKITKDLHHKSLICTINVTGFLEEKIKNGTFKALEEENNLRKRLSDSRSLDISTRKTLTGFQKASFDVFLIQNNLPALHSSSGEQKKALFACIIATVKKLLLRKRNIIVLIDEVIAKLDTEGQKDVINELALIEAQSFLTSTSAPLYDESPINIITL